MPGRIMENASINGSHMNHGREKRPNGINGNFQGGDKGKGRSEAQGAMSNSMEKMTPNGNSDNSMRDATTDRVEEVSRDTMSQLPPELLHITAGYISLGKLVTRVNERSHNDIEKAITDLAKMPMPSSAMNGNAAHYPSGSDDNSQENINKKKALLDFVLVLHERYVKLLVHSRWAERAEPTSRMIDLRVHLMNQVRRYEICFEAMAGMKRDMGFMRVRNPDLRTAVEVLSTGKCSSMPDLGFIEPPPLTAREILQTLKNLNTLISIRLNVHEYEKLPFHFRNYSIKSGRVTFHVPGEFELDLTIADDNPEMQFYFIDFRLLFTPKISQIPEALLIHLENGVNGILARDDPFTNCYKFLHEVVLTHKIGEMKKQAHDLNKGKWVGTLGIEPLERALCIQYWHGRHTAVKGPKSWIIIGVNSGKRKDGKFDAKATSRIGVRWFRDAKEVQDVNIPLDLDHISTESLLKTVIAKHVEYILTTTYDRLKDVPLYKEGDLAIDLTLSSTEPMESTLKLQATHAETIAVAIETTTGSISFSPASMLSMQFETHLNRKVADPAKDLASFLMEYRPKIVAQNIANKCASTGWEYAPNPGLKLDDIRSRFKRETQATCWLRRPEWKSQWYVVVGISLRGEEWQLVETETSGLKHPAPGPARGRALRDVSTVKISRVYPLPMTAVSPRPSYEFFATLQIFAVAHISQRMDLVTMLASSIRYTVEVQTAFVNATSIKVPKLLIQLQDLARFPDGCTPQQDKREGSLWAMDAVSLSFAGIETERKQVEPRPTSLLEHAAVTSTPSAIASTSLPRPLFEDSTNFVNHASVIVPSCKDLTLLSEQVDKDICFQASTGTFIIKTSTPLGQSCIPALQKRIQDIQRLVEFVKVMDSQKSRYLCESVSLNTIVFSYKSSTFVGNENGALIGADATSAGAPEVPYRVTVDVGSSKTTLHFEQGNPHIRMEDRFIMTLRKRGFRALLNQLTMTLALFTAFDAIVQSWAEFFPKSTVSCNIHHPQVYQLVYRLNPNPNKSSATAQKVVRLEISYRERGRVGQWMVKRFHDDSDPGPHTPDDVDARLREIWGTIGNNPSRPWKALNTCAASQVHAIGALLLALDSTIKSYVKQQAEPKSSTLAEKEKEPKNTAPAAKKEEINGRGLSLSFDGPSDVRSGPGPGPGEHHHLQQHSSRNVAPQAPMMAPRATMMPPNQQTHTPAQIAQHQARLQLHRQQMAALPPEAQQRAYRERMMNNQRAQAEQAAARQAQRDREVITLDD